MIGPFGGWPLEGYDPADELGVTELSRGSESRVAIYLGSPGRRLYFVLTPELADELSARIALRALQADSRSLLN